jgi:small-conductance mechanosensitive channel
MSERLDGKKQLEEMLNRPILDFDKKLFCAEDGSFITSDFGSFLQMQSMQHQIDELTQKLSETQKDLCFRRDLYTLQEKRLDQLSKDLIEARVEAKKWKQSHDNQVKINQLLRDRPDLGHRAKSVDALIKQRNELMEILVDILDALGATHKPHELEGYGITHERAKEIISIVAMKGGEA